MAACTPISVDLENNINALAVKLKKFDWGWEYSDCSFTCAKAEKNRSECISIIKSIQNDKNYTPDVARALECVIRSQENDQFTWWVYNAAGLK